MGTVTAPDMAFAEWLRAMLDERGWGVRTLARVIADKHDLTDIEVPRRAVNRYMKGARPTEFYAQAIADAFGIDRDQLPIEEAARSGEPFHGTRPTRRAVRPSPRAARPTGDDDVKEAA